MLRIYLSLIDHALPVQNYRTSQGGKTIDIFSQDDLTLCCEVLKKVRPVKQMEGKSQNTRQKTVIVSCIVYNCICSEDILIFIQKVVVKISLNLTEKENLMYFWHSRQQKRTNSFPLQKFNILQSSADKLKDQVSCQRVDALWLGEYSQK